MNFLRKIFKRKNAWENTFYICANCGNKIYWNKPYPKPDRNCPYCGINDFTKSKVKNCFFCGKPTEKEHRYSNPDGCEVAHPECFLKAVKEMRSDREG